ncbi:MAG: HAD family hydrolase [Bacilli bacterium]|jgi:phosphoglycolate phosphatase|nr:HAD family hydrolase [Bacilli bacterium]
MEKKKSLFFDLDGTLWDALDPLTESWNQAMKDAKKPFSFSKAKMQTFMGLTPEETCPLAFPGTSLKEGLELFHLELVAEIKYLALHPGILYPEEEKIIAGLAKKYPLYIISNSDKGYVENYLQACHMGKYFKDHVCVGDTGLVKWQNILYMKNKEHVSDVIYIGDTLKDKTEAEKAGVKFIHAAYGFGKIADDPYKINSLTELPPLVEILFKN